MYGFRARIVRQVVAIVGLFYIVILVVKRTGTAHCSDSYVIKRHSELTTSNTDGEPELSLIQKNNDILTKNVWTKDISTTNRKDEAASNFENVTIKSAIRVSLSCQDVGNLLADLANDESSIHRVENDVGNRAVYFTTVYDVDGHAINAVVKVANVYNESSEIEQYRYNSALREIGNLEKLHLLGFIGSPQLILYCVTPQQIAYVVTRVRNGVPICSADANGKKCSMAYDVIEDINSRPDPGLMAITWIEKVTSFFAQFERHNIFVEDISGSNFFYNHENFDLTIVDADSLLFYGTVPIFSRLSCRRDIDCPKPAGNLWGPNALNHKIYYACRERDGYCVKNTCRGFDSSLHACGIGRWLIIPLRGLIPDIYYNKYREIMHCMTFTHPDNRCSLSFASAKAKSLLEEIQNDNR